MPLCLRLLCVLVCLCCSAVLNAQSPQPTAAPETNIVFVPYDRLKGPEWGGEQSVLVPYAEFLRLRDGLRTPDPATRTKPVAALAEVRLDGRVEGGVARIDGTLTIDAIGRPDDRMVLDLPFEGLFLESVAVEGTATFVGPREGGVGLRVGLQGEGRRTLRLKMAAAVISAGGVERVQLGVPRAGAASLRLTLPGGAEPVAGEGLPWVAESVEGGVRLVAAFGGEQKATVAWRRRGADAPGDIAPTARFVAQSALSVTISSTLATFTQSIEVTPLQGKVGELALLVPDGVEVLSVQGSFLRETRPGDGGRVMVALVQEVGEKFSLTLAGQKRLSDADAMIRLEGIRVEGAARESGRLVLNPGGDLILWTERASGLEPTDATAARGGSADYLRAWRFEQAGWSLDVSRRAIDARVQVQSLLQYRITERQSSLHTRHQATVSGRAIFELSLRLPEGYRLIEAGPPELIAGFRQQPGGAQLAFRGSQSGAISFWLRLDGAPTSVPGAFRMLPLAIDGAQEDSGFVVLALPTELRATDQGSQGLEPTDVRFIDQALMPEPGEGMAPTLGYRYLTPEFAGSALIERQKPRVTSTASVLANVEPTVLRVDATMEFAIEFSPRDEFQLRLPAAAGEDVRFIGDGIKEKSRARPAPGDELTTWTIRLQRPAMPAYVLRVSFELPVALGEEGKEARLAIPRVEAAGVARETLFLGVARGENLEVRVARAEELERRDVKELPSALQSAFLGFRSFDPGKARLELELVRHELEAVLGAVVTRAHLATVVSNQREATHEAIFELRNNREQYLELKLPAGQTIWSAAVAGHPVRPVTRERDQASLIELAKAPAVGPFRVRLVLKETLPGGAMGSYGSLALRSVAPANMPVLRTTWAVYLPPGFRYLDYTGTMMPTGQGSTPWLEQGLSAGLVSVPSGVLGAASAEDFRPPYISDDGGFNPAETEAERDARVRAGGIEVPFVREGVEVRFHRISGIGEIGMNFFERRAFAALLAVAAVIPLLVLFLGARLGVAPLGLAVFWLTLLTVAGLAEGMAGRLGLAGFAGATLGGVLLIAHAGWWRLVGLFKKTPKGEPEPGAVTFVQATAAPAPKAEPTSSAAASAPGDDTLPPDSGGSAANPSTPDDRK